MLNATQPGNEKVFSKGHGGQKLVRDVVPRLITAQKRELLSGHHYVKVENVS